MRLLVVISVVAGLSGSARAEDLPPERSVAISLALPLGVTAAGLFLSAGFRNESVAWRIAGGAGLATVVVGPGLGRFYARDPSYGGTLVCLTGVSLVLYGIHVDRDALAPGDGFAIGLGGIALWTGGALYQIISAPIVTHRANRARWTIAPIPNGVALAGSF
jgi:hypothetical protein